MLNAWNSEVAGLPKALRVHPVANLFPDMPPGDFAALVEDIRRHGVRMPILVHAGQILDGRHRYRACQELGIPCPTVTWNSRDPWLEVQSLNLIRRHLSKEQVYAIRKLAIERFPELAGPIEAAKIRAKQRKAQAKDKPRGHKALSRPQDRRREAADDIGAQLGMSGTTIKRIDRLTREAPELLPKVAAGEISVKKALREVNAQNRDSKLNGNSAGFVVELALGRLQRSVNTEWTKWPPEHRVTFLRALQQMLRELIYEYKSTAGVRDANAIGADGSYSRNGGNSRVPESTALGPC